MKKVFMIDGGAGRVIAAIPALLKYHKSNPNNDWAIIIGGWDNLLWGIPELQDRTYSMDTKGIFDNVISKTEEIVSPEPYRVPGYFKQELSLAEAFDVLINNTNDHKDLGVPKMVFSKQEEYQAAKFISEVKQQMQKQKTIIIQPYGRSANRVDEENIIDESSRSLDQHSYLSLVKKLTTKYNVVFMGEEPQVVPQDTFTFKTKADLRMWGAFIESADYFVGCDSLGQHMARAVETPGTVIIGSTYAINTSYPDYFNIFEKEGMNKKYSPIRISGLDSHLADRYNDKLMDYSEEDVSSLYKSIVEDIEKKVK